MVRAFLPRLTFFRTLGRISSPLLPTVRHRPLTPAPSSISRVLPSRPFHNSSSSSSTPSSRDSSPDQRTSLPADATLSQRLRHLIKSYGWYALGVYMVLSVVDFGVAFVGISLLGADYVSHIAATVKEAVTSILHSQPAEPGRDEIESASKGPTVASQEGLYAMLVLAYTIHKTLFVPVRIGLTAAFTPRLVGWLSQRGWTGRAGTRRAASEIRDKLRERGDRGD